MKVLISIPCLLRGGTEIQTLYLVKALAKLGHEVATVCYFEHSDEQRQCYEEAGSRVYLCSPSDAVRPQGVGGNFRFLLRELKKVCDDFRPDVIHVQYMAPGALPILIYRLLGHAHVVATTHTSADIYSPLGKAVVRQVARWLTRRFTCPTLQAESSYFGTSRLIDETDGTLPHVTLPDTLPDTLRFEAREEESVMRIGVVSRLERIKGMDLVVPAFAQLHKECPALRLSVVGEGSLLPLMHEQANTLQVSDFIDWEGALPHEAVFQHLRGVNVLWMPSRSEGFGLSALEAMSQGCCVVASATGGLCGIVTNETDGLLFPPEDVDTLVRLTVGLVNSPSRANNMGRAAVSKAKTFSFEHFLKNVELLYRGGKS